MIAKIFWTTVMLFCSTIYNWAQSPLMGAWEASEGDAKVVIIVADKYFSVAYYQDAEFIGTLGGQWRESSPGRVTLTLEFDSRDPYNVGEVASFDYTLKEDKFSINGGTYTRIDDGTPGDLNDAWLMTARKRGDQMNKRQNGPRKTMKILSGTRFQWIAFDTEKKTFSGSGGGTYTTVDGTYTENIEFFSRDNSRVGAALPFTYKLADDGWHHSGLSSKGDPIYEVWTSRSKVEME